MFHVTLNELWEAILERVDKNNEEGIANFVYVTTKLNIFTKHLVLCMSSIPIIWLYTCFLFLLLYLFILILPLLGKIIRKILQDKYNREGLPYNQLIFHDMTSQF